MLARVRHCAGMFGASVCRNTSLRSNAGSRRMKKRPDEISGVEMAGEAIHLLRAAPLHALMAYYIGSAPFVLVFLYFWSEMSGSAFAAPRCFGLSFLLAALFVWMKFWQSIFSSDLRAVLAGTEPSRPTFREVPRLVLRQGAIQPYGLLLIPAAMLVMVPFYSVHAFFQNMTVLDDGSDPDTRHLARRAWRQALLWPKQNHIALWLVSPWVLYSLVATVVLVVWMGDIFKTAVPSDLGYAFLAIMLLMLAVSLVPLCPFGCTVAVNIAATLIFVPAFADRIFGVSSAFVRGGTNSFMNTTFLMTVMGLSYLCLDPVVKAIHVLRCFHGEAVHSGADLLAELRSIREDRP